MDKTEIDSASATDASTAEAISSPIGGDRRTLEERIGFIGLGRMGRIMAGHLATGGCRVIGYDRRPESATEIQADGIEPAVKIADLFDCGFVISMLTDDAAVREIVFGYPGHAGLCSGLGPGAVHLSMSTISPSAAAEFAEAHRKSGQCYVAAPVFGNPDAAKARELF